MLTEPSYFRQCQKKCDKKPTLESEKRGRHNKRPAKIWRLPDQTQSGANDKLRFQNDLSCQPNTVGFPRPSNSFQGNLTNMKIQGEWTTGHTISRQISSILRQPNCGWQFVSKWMVYDVFLFTLGKKRRCLPEIKTSCVTSILCIGSVQRAYSGPRGRKFKSCHPDLTRRSWTDM